jgi:hypothetical protein
MKTHRHFWGRKKYGDTTLLYPYDLHTEGDTGGNLFLSYSFPAPLTLGPAEGG